MAADTQVDLVPISLLADLPTVSFLPELSGYEPGKVHPKYGELSGRWSGLEFKYDDVVQLEGIEGGISLQRRILPDPNKGIVIARKSLAASSIFVIENADWILCTDMFRSRVLRSGLSGVDFLQYGRLAD